MNVPHPYLNGSSRRSLSTSSTSLFPVDWHYCPAEWSGQWGSWRYSPCILAIPFKKSEIFVQLCDVFVQQFVKTLEPRPFINGFRGILIAFMDHFPNQCPDSPWLLLFKVKLIKVFIFEEQIRHTHLMGEEMERRVSVVAISDSKHPFLGNLRSDSSAPCPSTFVMAHQGKVYGLHSSCFLRSQATCRISSWTCQTRRCMTPSCTPWFPRLPPWSSWSSSLGLLPVRTPLLRRSLSYNKTGIECPTDRQQDPWRRHCKWQCLFQLLYSFVFFLVNPF